jgi:nucleotide-binding universal stress UspA family protein
MFKTILWGSDGSAFAESALPLAKGIAQSSGARLLVVHVDEMAVGLAGAIAVGAVGYPDYNAVSAALQRIAEDLNQEGIDAQFVSVKLTVGGVAGVLADSARDADADLIVVGTRGRNPIVGLLVGGVTHRLLEIAPCPVLAVPAKQAQEENS